MTAEQIEALVRAAEGRGLAALEFAAESFKLSVVFEREQEPGNAPSVQAPRAVPLLPPQTAIVSPGVGLFRLRHPVGGAVPKRGDRLAAGATVAFVQAGPLLQPVTAPREGTLGVSHVDDGVGVGYGTPLFELI
jgi:biotin carboxyl carrier protein